MVWCSMIHHGINSQKARDCSWSLKQLFSRMKNRLSDGADDPYFFRDLGAMITDVKEIVSGKGESCL